MDISNNENPMKVKFNSAVNTLGRYFKNSRTANKQAYYLGQKDIITELAEFIWTETNGNPSEISVLRVLEYLEVKQMQFQQNPDLNAQKNIPKQTNQENNGLSRQENQRHIVSHTNYMSNQSGGVNNGDEGIDRIEEEEPKTYT